MARREPSPRPRLEWQSRLGWLIGHPLRSAEWRPVTDRGLLGPTFALDALRVSTTLRALKTMLREAPDELARRVGDVDEYSARVQLVLARLGARVRHPGPAGGLWSEGGLFSARIAARVERLRTARPRLGDVLDAFSWIFATRRDVSEALGVVEESAATLDGIAARLGSDVALRCALIHLRVQHLDPILELLTEPAVHHTSLDPRARDDGSTPRAGSLGRALLPFVDALAVRDPREVRRAARLVEHLRPREWIEEWVRIAETISAAELAVRKARARFEAVGRLPGAMGRLMRSEAKHALDLAESARRAAAPQTSPWVRTPDQLAAALSELAASSDGIVDALCELLDARAHDETPGSRERFVIRAADELEDASSARVDDLARLWHMLARALPEEPRLATLWARLDRPAPGGGWCWGVELELLGEPPTRRSPAMVLDVLRALAAEGVDLAEHELLELAVQHRAQGVPLARVVRRAKLLSGAEDVSTYPIERDVVASALAGDDDETFATIFARLDVVASRRLHGLLPAIRAAGLEARFAQAIVDGERERVLERLRWMGGIGGALDRVVAPLRAQLVAEPERAWVEEYPEALRAALNALVDVDPGAQETANRLLGATLRSSASITEELTALEAKLPGAVNAPALERRIALLRARASNWQPSPRTLAKLEEKVLRAKQRAELAAFERVLSQSAVEHAAELLGLAGAPSWWDEPKALGIWSAVLGLSAPLRALGVELLRRRHGPRPWDLRDRPENAAFLDRLAARGLCVEPWLESNTTTVEAHGLVLALEDDPLEILKMGEYFKTCLSIEGVNFYSAVVNAAEVNKRVLYARTRDGRVVGRCLLALSGLGELATFAAYCHSSEVPFEQIVADFARALATRMKSRISRRGEIPRLLAPRWYDDGARDFATEELRLREDASLLEALRSQELGVCMERIRAHGPIERALAHAVLQLPEAAARRDLAEALLRVPGLVEGLEVAERLELAAHLEASTPELAATLVDDPRVPHWLTHCHECRGLCVSRQTEATLMLLARLRPRRLFQLVRAMRRKGWTPTPEQLRAEAFALDRLHRPAQAGRVRARLERSAATRTNRS
jgi:hypothetical protein